MDLKKRHSELLDGPGSVRYSLPNGDRVYMWPSGTVKVITQVGEIDEFELSDDTRVMIALSMIAVAEEIKHYIEIEDHVR